VDQIWNQRANEVLQLMAKVPPKTDDERDFNELCGSLCQKVKALDMPVVS
jgi:hypothetical protein